MNTLDAQIDPEVSRLVSQEGHLIHAISAGCELKHPFTAICQNLLPEVNRVLLDVLVSITDLVEIKLQPASVDDYVFSLVIDGAEWPAHLIILVLRILLRNRHEASHDVREHLPYFSTLFANAHHEV